MLKTADGRIHYFVSLLFLVLQKKDKFFFQTRYYTLSCYPASYPQAGNRIVHDAVDDGRPLFSNALLDQFTNEERVIFGLNDDVMLVDQCR